MRGGAPETAIPAQDDMAKQSGSATPIAPLSGSNVPVIPLPNPGEGGPAYPGDSDNIPSIPLPPPGGPAYPGDSDNVPSIPLPPPGSGGPAFPGNGGGIPIIPLPPPGSGPALPGIRPPKTRVRFLNAAYGYHPFRILINQFQAVRLLNYGGLTSYGWVSTGYQTITVTGTDGYIYLQKTMPFQANVVTTIAVINRPGGLDLLQITDTCCPPSTGANFRVCNLAQQSNPIDVLLADGRVIYTDVRFKETTAFKRIWPGEYQFIFAETNLMPMPLHQDIETLDSGFLGMYPPVNVVSSLYLRVARGANYTTFLLSTGTFPDDIQAIVAEDY